MSYNTCRARVFYNYADVKDWHDKTPPIRNNKDKVKPLGSRRHWYMASIAMDGEDVVFNYYMKKAVTWHPDDSITVHYPTYCTAFEPDKMAHFLPPRLSYEWNQRRLVVHNGWDNTRVVVEQGKPVKLIAVGVETFHGSIVRKYKFAELPSTFKYVKRRGVASKIVTQEFKPFLDWVELSASFTPHVTGDEYAEATEMFFYQHSGISERRFNKGKQWHATTPWDEANSQRKYDFAFDVNLKENYPMGGSNSFRTQAAHKAGIEALFNMLKVENQDQWLKALQIIAGHHCPKRWRDRSTMYLVDMKYIRDYVERIVCVVRRDDVFNKVPVAAGDIPTKAHTEYFKEMKFTYFENTDNVSDISV